MTEKLMLNFGLLDCCCCGRLADCNIVCRSRWLQFSTAACSATFSTEMGSSLNENVEANAYQTLKIATMECKTYMELKAMRCSANCSYFKTNYGNWI